MSVENVKKFYEAVSQDKELQQKLIELSKKYQGQQMDEAKEMAIMEQDALPLAKQLGYDFTMDDLKAYGEKKRQADTDRELSEEEMEAVAGGTGIFCLSIGYNTDFDCIDGGLCIFWGMVGRV